MARNPHKTIVIAWVDVESEYSGIPFAADLGERPIMIDTTASRAVVWLNEGTDGDVLRAREYATSNGYQVLTYPVDTPNVLDRARDDVLAIASRAGR